VDGKVMDDNLYSFLRFGDKFNTLDKPKFIVVSKYSREDEKSALVESYIVLSDEGKEYHSTRDWFKRPYVVENSIIYRIGRNYYNILTNELYANNCTNTIESDRFLFIDTKFSRNAKNKREYKGIMKLDKKSREVEYFN